MADPGVHSRREINGSGREDEKAQESCERERGKWRVRDKWSWGVFEIQRHFSSEDSEGCTVEMEGRKDAAGLRR